MSHPDVIYANMQNSELHIVILRPVLCNVIGRNTCTGALKEGSVFTHEFVLIHKFRSVVCNEDCFDRASIISIAPFRFGMLRVCISSGCMCSIFLALVVLALCWSVQMGSVTQHLQSAVWRGRIGHNTRDSAVSVSGITICVCRTILVRGDLTLVPAWGQSRGDLACILKALGGAPWDALTDVPWDALAGSLEGPLGVRWRVWMRWEMCWRMKMR